MDCMEFMKDKPDNYYDLAIVDPPYGRNALDGSKTALKYGIDRSKNWDCHRPTPTYFKEILRASINIIIFGGNYFISDLDDTKCMIVIDKSNIPDSFRTMSPVEIAWTSFDKPSSIFRVNTNTGQKIHPTQKPVALYRWLLTNYAKPNDKILDTHGGSFSSAIACHMEGFDLDICELDGDYFNDAVKRFKLNTIQEKLF